MAIIVDREQLAAELGVAESTIDSWERAGCPVFAPGRRGRGGKTLYDLVAVRAWQGSTGRGVGPHAVMARARRLAALPPRPDAGEISRHVRDAILQAYVDVLAEGDAAVGADLAADLLESMIAAIAERAGATCPDLRAALERFLERLPGTRPGSYAEAIWIARSAVARSQRTDDGAA